MTFNLDAFSRSPLLIYIGDEDEFNSTLWGVGELWRTWDQIWFLNSLFGATDPNRVQRQVEYLQDHGFPLIEFRMYPGVGHTISNEMVNDTLEFFESHKD